jgi:HEAT repeat protein
MFKTMKLWYYLHQLRHRNHKVRCNAADVLVKLGDPGTVEALIKSPHNMSTVAIWVLGEIGDPRAVEPLIKCLGSEFWGDREPAAEALGKIGDPRAVEPLIKCLVDMGGARRAAAIALVKLGQRQYQHLGTVCRDLAEDLALLGFCRDPRVVGPLTKFLEDKDWKLRQAAALAIGRLGHPELLIKALGGVGEAAAAVALGQLGDQRALKPLIKVLGDQDKDVRLAAVAALHSLGGPRSVEPLIKALDDNNWEVRKAAIEVLGVIGDPRAVKPLIKCLDVSNGPVCWFAAKAVRKLSDQRVVKTLDKAIVDKIEAALRDELNCMEGKIDPEENEKYRFNLY